MMIENIKIFLETLKSINLIYFLVVPFLGFLAYIWKFLYIQFRFAKNIKKKIYFFKTSDKNNMQTEKDLIKEIEFFNVISDIKDISSSTKAVQNCSKDAVYIVGYSAEYGHYKELIKFAQSHGIPIIIFAKQGAIQEGHFKFFNEYIYCDVANTSARLAMILMNILMIVRP